MGNSGNYDTGTGEQAPRTGEFLAGVLALSRISRVTVALESGHGAGPALLAAVRAVVVLAALVLDLAAKLATERAARRWAMTSRTRALSAETSPSLPAPIRPSASKAR